MDFTIGDVRHSVALMLFTYRSLTVPDSHRAQMGFKKQALLVGIVIVIEHANLVLPRLKVQVHLA